MILTSTQIIKKYNVSKTNLDLWRRGVLFRSRGKNYKALSKLPSRRKRGDGCEESIRWFIEKELLDQPKKE